MPKRSYGSVGFFEVFCGFHISSWQTSSQTTAQADFGLLECFCDYITRLNAECLQADLDVEIQTSQELQVSYSSVENVEQLPPAFLET